MKSLSQPDMFHLAINYRSHTGIVNCAHSVIHLITQFWPDAIDALAPEQGVVDGTKPFFFAGEDGTMDLEDFLFGDSDNPIEFGAQQCKFPGLISIASLLTISAGIIVRDDSARKKLEEQIGDTGLIM